MKKTLKEYVLEAAGSPIDDNWLNNEKPVQTKDGRTAVIFDIDISVVPNVIKGQVQNDDKMSDYEWDDTGRCIKATDKLGNPQRPTDNDKLVKGA